MSAGAMVINSMALLEAQFKVLIINIQVEEIVLLKINQEMEKDT